ncbi:hypothetical protein BDV93DRAFT_601505 [Ceratobasidium sp. AG-I]|nr:hypothetical protein BDV93DRAFT_601505 [Ceratobasidium sp. AG-I]
MDHSSPTKVGRSQLHGILEKRMKRELLPREPQVSVVTQTIYASSTSTSTGLPLPADNSSIPLGPIVGGIAGGVFLVLLAVGGWMWWGSRMRAAKAKGAKARRAQDLAAARTGHSKTESTDTLNTIRSKTHSQSSHLSEKSEKSEASSTHEVKKPSAILAQQKSSRSPFTHNAPSTTSLASSRYAPSRPSPLALAVVTRPSSQLSSRPPTVVVTVPPQLSPLKPLARQSASAVLRSLAPLPPAVNVVPPSPPPPAPMLLAPAAEKTQRQSVQSVQSVQTVASEYSLDSPVGVAYGGDELELEAHKNPRDEWRDSNGDVMNRMSADAQARQPVIQDGYFSQNPNRL